MKEQPEPFRISPTLETTVVLISKHRKALFNVGTLRAKNLDDVRAHIQSVCSHDPPSIVKVIVYQEGKEGGSEFRMRTTGTLYVPTKKKVPASLRRLYEQARRLRKENPKLTWPKAIKKANRELKRKKPPMKR